MTESSPGDASPTVPAPTAPAPGWVHPGSLLAQAATARELAAYEAADARAAEGRSLTDSARAAASERRRERRTALGGPSVKFSVRLGHEDLAALERRADLLGLSPSALARNLIRYGLTTRQGYGVDALVGDLETVTAKLRAAVS